MPGVLTLRLVVLWLFALACAPTSMPPPPPSAPASPPEGKAAVSVAWQTLAKESLEEYLERSPVGATSEGEHRYDGRWPDVSAQGEARFRRFLAATQQRLAELPREELGLQERIDAQILENVLRYRLFSLDELRPSEEDPRFYTDLIGDGLDPLVHRSFGTPASRLASLLERLDGIPALVAEAKQRLRRPSRVNTETAIRQNLGLIRLVEQELASHFVAAGEPLAARSQRAAAALRDLQAFFEKELLPRSDSSFRLGRERFSKKLSLVLQDDVDLDALAASARELLERTQGEMVATARQIWEQEKLGALPALETPSQRKSFVKRVLDHVADDHSTNQSIVGDARQWLAKATAFVREHDLVRVPDDPLQVIEMPEYRRGVAIAYCDASGPLEPTPETFFAISPTPADWSKERTASFYREYNQAMLADLTVHEAMPGHYLQLMHNNAFGSKLRAVFSSGAFVEGWAVYSEWLLAEKGFGGPRVKLQRQKMVLRLASNALLDHGVHAGQMDEAEAMALMTGEAFQEEGEAVGKWRRARMTSAQLTTYFYGFTQLLALRRAAEAEPAFNERRYHDRLLSWGSPAPSLVRELLRTAP
jgi:uncharacterized protein (DUF885 family)